MTIDEAINFVENMIYNYRPYGEQLEDWNKLLNLLRWYKGQDLIRREDIPKYELWCYARRNETEFNALIEQIPKAEPPKEND